MAVVSQQLVSSLIVPEAQDMCGQKVGGSMQASYESEDNLMSMGRGDELREGSLDQNADAAGALEPNTMALANEHASLLEGFLTDVNFDDEVGLELNNTFAPLQKLSDKVDPIPPQVLQCALSPTNLSRQSSTL